MPTAIKSIQLPEEAIQSVPSSLQVSIEEIEKGNSGAPTFSAVT